MKRNLLALFLLLNLWQIKNLNAQDIEVTEPKKEIIVKIYSNFLYFNSDYNPKHFEFTKKPFQFWGLTPAVSFRDKKSAIIHEFEPRIWFSSRDNGDIKEYEIGLRYELNWYLKKELFKGMRFRWGPSARVYYYNADFAQHPLYGFLAIAKNGGLEFSLAAHFEYQIAKKIKLELTTSNFNFNFVIDSLYVENPGLTEYQKSQGGFDFDYLNQNILRLGISYEL